MGFTLTNSHSSIHMWCAQGFRAQSIDIGVSMCVCAIHIFLDTIQSDYKVARANTYTDTKLGVALGVAKIFYFEHLGERDFCSRCARNKYRWWNFKLCGDQSRTQTVEARWTGRRRCVRKYCGNGGGTNETIYIGWEAKRVSDIGPSSF